MALRRIQRKTERTPEELAELRAARATFQRDRPAQDEITASGDSEGPFRQGDITALLSALAALKRERERQGLSLAEVSERSGLDKGMISRLENGKILNPTVTTLWRYADAVGMRMNLSAEKPAAVQA
jgi:ribosome-binding protein aMBF1 (putative translation factor)